MTAARGVKCVLAALLLLAPPQARAEPVLELIATDQQGGTDGALSPDGRYIVASSRRSETWSLWLFDRAKRTWSMLTDDGGEDTEPQWSPDGRQIVFSSWREEQKDIWIIDVESRRMSKVTDDDIEEEYPAWSPDGNLIVFTGGPWKWRNFYLAPAGGGTSRAVLAEPGHVGACSFGPDGNRLYCHTYDTGFGDLIEVTLEGGAVRRLTAGESWHYKPTASPNGRWLAYSELSEDGDRVRLVSTDGRARSAGDLALDGRWPMFTRDGRGLFFHRVIDEGAEIRLLDRITGRATLVVGGDRRPGRASLSPDGSAIAYCSRKGPRRSVWILDRRTLKEHRLAVPGAACYPAWSPDGRELAVTYRSDARWEIATVRPDGSDLRIWTASDEGLRDLNAPISWSPDGRRLAFASTTYPYESDLMVIDRAQGRLHNVTGDAWYDEGPRWTPDGSRLIFMSTRGGDWTWGLFARSLASGETVALLEPDYVEKRFPVLAPDGALYWIETNRCLGSTFIARRSPGGDQEVLTEHPGARWVEVSKDGRFLLFTLATSRTEYWLADLTATLPERGPQRERASAHAR